MFPIASSSTTQTQKCGHRTAASVLTGGVVAVACLIGTNSFANAAEDSLRLAQEQHACAVVMGLHQPGDLYDTCIRSLNKTLSELDEVRQASTERSACTQEGLKPGTPAFASCVVNAEQSPADAGRYAVDVSDR
jgi:hypothetical protein